MAHPPLPTAVKTSTMDSSHGEAQQQQEHLQRRAQVRTSNGLKKASHPPRHKSNSMDSSQGRSIRRSRALDVSSCHSSNTSSTSPLDFDTSFMESPSSEARRRRYQILATATFDSTPKSYTTKRSPTTSNATPSLRKSSTLDGSSSHRKTATRSVRHTSKNSGVAKGSSPKKSSGSVRSNTTGSNTSAPIKRSSRGRTDNEFIRDGSLPFLFSSEDDKPWPTRRSKSQSAVSKHSRRKSLSAQDSNSNSQLQQSSKPSNNSRRHATSKNSGDAATTKVSSPTTPKRNSRSVRGVRSNTIDSSKSSHVKPSSRGRTTHTRTHYSSLTSLFGEDDKPLLHSRPRSKSQSAVSKQGRSKSQHANRTVQPEEVNHDDKPSLHSRPRSKSQSAVSKQGRSKSQHANRTMQPEEVNHTIATSQAVSSRPERSNKETGSTTVSQSPEDSISRSNKSPSTTKSTRPGRITSQSADKNKTKRAKSASAVKKRVSTDSIQKLKKTTPEETRNKSSLPEPSKDVLVTRNNQESTLDCDPCSKTQEPRNDGPMNRVVPAPPARIKERVRLVTFGANTGVTFEDEQEPSTKWYTKEDLSMLLNHEISITWRSASNQSMENAAVTGKTLHCCWRGFEHIRLQYNKTERNQAHVMYILTAQEMLKQTQEESPAEKLRLASRHNSKEDRKKAYRYGLDDASEIFQDVQRDRMNEMQREVDEATLRQLALSGAGLKRGGTVNAVGTLITHATIGSRRVGRTTGGLSVKNPTSIKSHSPKRASTTGKLFARIKGST
jgi:hypothetical protein